MGYGIVIFGLLGLAVGSFLNVCIDRLPVGQNLLRPPSRCPACERRLAVKDLIPVFSYLWLRGRCRYCQAHIPRRVLWIELGTGLVFALLWWLYGLTPELGVMSFYYCLLLVILVIDLEHGLILNKVVYPAIVIALIIAAFGSSFGVVMGLMGGGVGLLAMLVIALIYRGGMGWGDVKMAGLVGVMVGFPNVLVALLLAVVGGGLVAAVLLALRIKKRGDALAFGPFLASATVVAFLWGQNLVDWYLGLF